MKAVYFNQYISKKGTLTYTYKVNGTAIEIEQYKSIQETNTNRAAGTWPEDAGAPLFFLAVPTLTRNGEVPQPQYNLIFNRDNTRVIRDNSAQQMQSWTRIEDKKENYKAELMAKLELGLIERPAARGAVFVTPTVAAPIPTPAGTEKPDLVDEVMNKMQPVGAVEGADGLEDLGG